MAAKFVLQPHLQLYGAEARSAHRRGAAEEIPGSRCRNAAGSRKEAFLLAEVIQEEAARRQTRWIHRGTETGVNHHGPRPTIAEVQSRPDFWTKNTETLGSGLESVIKRGRCL